jgi:FKBP-type peptidyl-prolyl cis-trans isomerase FklB
MQSDLQKSSYALGVEYMKSLRKDDLALDQDNFVLGMNDALNNQAIRLAPKDLQNALDGVFAERVRHNNKVAAANLLAGQAFLEANRHNPGVQRLPNGLQYKVLVDGKGNRKPSINDTVSVHYRIARLDGKELFDTATQAAAVKVNNVIKGWQQALLLMPEGSKWQLYIPAALAYGEAGAPNGRLGPNEVLIYDVELLGIKPALLARPDSTPGQVAH